MFKGLSYFQMTKEFDETYFLRDYSASLLFTVENEFDMSHL